MLNWPRNGDGRESKRRCGRLKIDYAGNSVGPEEIKNCTNLISSLHTSVTFELGEKLEKIENTLGDVELKEEERALTSRKKRSGNAFKRFTKCLKDL